MSVDSALNHDILRMVFEEFRPQPTPRRLGYLPVLLDAEREKQKTLYNLALVNKKFNALATPILYSVMLPHASGDLHTSDSSSASAIRRPSTYAAGVSKANSTYTRKLHLFYSKLDSEAEDDAMLALLAACAPGIEGLYIQGDIDWVPDRLDSLLVACKNLQHLAVCLPLGDKDLLYGILYPLSREMRTLSSIQMSPHPETGWGTPEEYSVVARLSVLAVHIDTEAYKDPLHGLCHICKAGAVQVLSVRGSCESRLWTPETQQFGPWDNLLEIHLYSEHQHNDLSLAFDSSMRTNAFHMLPVIENLRITLLSEGADGGEAERIRCLPSNLARLYIGEYAPQGPLQMAEVLTEDPRVLPFLSELEIGAANLWLCWQRHAELRSGLETLQAICKGRGIKTKPENLTAGVPWTVLSLGRAGLS